jgi:hypothetical protein
MTQKEIDNIYFKLRKRLFDVLGDRLDTNWHSFKFYYFPDLWNEIKGSIPALDKK